MTRDFFDPTSEEQIVVLVNAATLRKAEQLIESCEACNRDVNHLWKVVNEIGARIILPVSDRYYGLRDFTIADPDGFGVRFATLLQT